MMPLGIQTPMRSGQRAWFPIICSHPSPGWDQDLFFDLEAGAPLEGVDGSWTSAENFIGRRRNRRRVGERIGCRDPGKQFVEIVVR